MSVLIINNLALEDKNRPAVYSFTLDDFRNRSAVYLPDGEDIANIAHLRDLPHEYDLLEQPAENRIPDFYKMEIEGSMIGNKESKAITIIFTGRCYNILAKYRYLL